MQAMKLAVVSDIHGNRLALEAVLHDMRRQGVDRVINLGDLLSGPLEPAETADLLMELAWPTIAGNHERQLLACAQARPDPGHADRFAFSRVSPAHRAWLAALPATLRMDEADVWACHGMPGDDLHYFLEDVGPGGARLASPRLIAARAQGIAASLIVCGHSHKPRVLALSDGRLIVNPGSVGLQAYEDSHPGFHVIENGSPHARYAVCEWVHGQGWQVALRAVAYDFRAAARLARANGAPDWAFWLETGRVAQ